MKTNQDNIFIDQKNSEKSEDKRIQEKPVSSIPYLKRGDSIAYINQFLDKPEQCGPKVESSFTPVVKENIKEQDAHSNQQNESSQPQETRINPSAFHNFQKHLTVALKHAIVLPSQEKLFTESMRAAAKLWKIFEQSKICTKKVLHFLLGERNQHQITAQDLRQFGFSKVYDHFGEKVIRQARGYLMKEALRQIREGCLQSYFEHKRIKDKQKFKKYVSMFVEQLQQGFLRKRLPREKVIQLIQS